MAFISLGKPFHLLPFPAGITFHGGSSIIDATGEKVGCVFNVPKAGVLDTVECAFRTVTFAGSSVVRAGFQDITTNGIADGTFDQYREFSTGPTSIAWWTGPGLITSDGTDTGTKRTVALGQTMAFVLDMISRDGTDTLQLSAPIGAMLGYAGTITHPPSIFQNLGSPVISALGYGASMVLKYDDGSYAIPEGCNPFTTISSSPAFSNNAATREVGNVFTPNAPLRISGICVAGDLDGASWNIVLYTGTSETNVQAASVLLRNTTGSSFNFFPFTAPWDLDAGVLYRIVLRPTTTTTMVVRYGDVPNTAGILADYYQLATAYYTSKSSGGTFTDDITKIAFLSPMVIGISDGAGGNVGVNRALLASGVSSLG